MNLEAQHKVLLLWSCFLLRGAFYATILPIWEGVDEWAHFAVIQRYSESGSLLIDRNILVSREIDESLKLVPLPRGMTRIPPYGVTHEQYWQLSGAERARRETGLRRLPVEWGRESVEGAMPAYEASQPPLYYWLMAIPTWSMRHLSLVDRVWLTRILTLLLGSLAVPVGFMLTRRLFADESMALGMTALVAVTPELAITVSRVSNESLAIAVYSLLLFAGVRELQQPEPGSRAFLPGTVLGLGLLTKAHFLTAIPALALTGMWLGWRYRGNRGKHRPRFASLTAIFAIAVAIGGWWYLRNYSETGTLSGLDEALIVGNRGYAEQVTASLHVNWPWAIATIMLSHVWYGGWSLLALPRSIYYVSFAVMATALVGLLRARAVLRNPRVFFLLSAYVLFWIGQFYHVVMLYLSKGTSTAMGGWYLYSVVWAEVVLGIVGISSLVTARFRGFALAALIGAVAAVDLYGMHFVSLPYYAQSDLSRLLINKPAFFGPVSLQLLWVVYLTCTAAIVLLGVRSFKAASSYGIRPQAGSVDDRHA